MTDLRLQNRRCHISPTHRATSFSVLDKVLRSRLWWPGEAGERYLELEELPSAWSVLSNTEHTVHLQGKEQLRQLLHAGERNPRAKKSFRAESQTEECHSCLSATHQSSFSCPKT